MRPVLRRPARNPVRLLRRSAARSISAATSGKAENARHPWKARSRNEDVAFEGEGRRSVDAPGDGRRDAIAWGDEPGKGRHHRRPRSEGYLSITRFKRAMAEQGCMAVPDRGPDRGAVGYALQPLCCPEIGASCRAPPGGARYRHRKFRRAPHSTSAPQGRTIGSWRRSRHRSTCRRPPVMQCMSQAVDRSRAALRRPFGTRSSSHRNFEPGNIGSRGRPVSAWTRSEMSFDEETLSSQRARAAALPADDRAERLLPSQHPKR